MIPDTNLLAFTVVGVVGAGAMGRGIAQILAQAGCQVLWFDQQTTALTQAQQSLEQTWNTLVKKNKMTQIDQQVAIKNIQLCADLDGLKSSELIIEAIIENLDVKKQLWKQIEALVTPQTVLATNTSSLSVTAMGRDMQHPERLVGFHFFNPVPLMKVVEVVQGLKTSSDVVQRLLKFAKQFGHTGVVAQDTPGFIVNHAGRGYLTEALRIVSEKVADFATIDRILRDQLGFKLGPFELLDLTALDVSHPVMESIYHQYYQEPRYRPNPITAQRLAGGVVGKKVGEGFYRYIDGKAEIPPPTPPTPSANGYAFCLGSCTSHSPK